MSAERLLPNNGVRETQVINGLRYIPTGPTETVVRIDRPPKVGEIFSPAAHMARMAKIDAMMHAASQPPESAPAEPTPAVIATPVTAA